mmetsp:Transcript_105708/g.309182  ORF Transcript_105708/g.309182 Transcript_105708/m.309182 type:complete len:323 (-) Transcript_105708:529-1497(-)
MALVAQDQRHALDHSVDHPVELLRLPELGWNVGQVVWIHEAADDAGPSGPRVDGIVEESRRGQQEHCGSRVSQELAEAERAAGTNKLGMVGLQQLHVAPWARVDGSHEEVGQLQRNRAGAPVLEVDPADLQAAAAVAAHEDVAAVRVAHQQGLAPPEKSPDPGDQHALPRLQHSEGREEGAVLGLEELRQEVPSLRGLQKLRPRHSVRQVALDQQPLRTGREEIADQPAIRGALEAQAEVAVSKHALPKPVVDRDGRLLCSHVWPAQVARMKAGEVSHGNMGNFQADIHHLSITAEALSSHVLHQQSIGRLAVPLHREQSPS